jgi:hypothetical protein
VTFGVFVVLVISAIAIIYFLFAAASMRVDDGAISVDERMMASALIVVTLFYTLMIRPAEFSIDAPGYYTMYAQYCYSNSSIDLSYSSTFGLINFLSAGACNPGMLIPIWVAIFVLFFFFLPIDIASRVKLLALALFSLVGVELTTNILRQGISAVVMMLAIAWYPRSKMLAAVLAIAGITLHPSSALVVLAFGMARLPWRLYTVIIVSLTATFIFMGDRLASVPVLERLTYEVTKYSVHEADDLYIRLLAAFQLAVLVLSVQLFGKTEQDGDGRQIADKGLVLRLACTAIPFLSLPYFGYRYIYGIYPAILYVSLPYLLQRRPLFEIVLVANALVLMAWAFGSSYMRDAIFVVL